MKIPFFFIHPFQLAAKVTPHDAAWRTRRQKLYKQRLPCKRSKTYFSHRIPVVTANNRSQYLDVTEQSLLEIPRKRWHRLYIRPKLILRTTTLMCMRRVLVQPFHDLFLFLNFFLPSKNVMTPISSSNLSHIFSNGSYIMLYYVIQWRGEVTILIADFSIILPANTTPGGKSSVITFFP